MRGGLVSCCRLHVGVCVLGVLVGDNGGRKKTHVAAGALCENGGFVTSASHY